MATAPTITSFNKIGSMNRLTKQILAIMSLTLIGCLYLQHVSDSKRPSMTIQRPSQQSCRPHSNIVFIKAHKCASSAIQNIFMRYGFMNNKTFVLPSKGNYLGHPALFNRNLVPDPKLFHGNYNILTHHSRLNYPEMRSLMPKNSVYITIIRKPTNLFESMFHYYKLNRLWGINFDDFNAINLTIPKKVREVRLVGKIGINQMMFDMGFPPRHFENIDQIKDYINFLDSIFSLVMVAERMEESLILLRKLLCWKHKDVVVFKVNARNDKSKRFLNETGIKRIEELNKADQMLYDYFSEKFDKQVKLFGLKRMEKEIEVLRNKTKSYYDLCVDKTLISEKTHIVRFVTSKEDNPVCKFLTQSELTLTKFIRNEQIKRYPLSVFPNVTVIAP